MTESAPQFQGQPVDDEAEIVQAIGGLVPEADWIPGVKLNSKLDHVSVSLLKTPAEVALVAGDHHGAGHLGQHAGVLLIVVGVAHAVDELV